MKLALGLFVASVLALAPSCSKLRQTESTDASLASAQSGPRIRVQGSEIQLDEKPAGSTRVIEDMGRMQKLDDLFDQLKAQRELYKSANPNQTFPGRATIGLPPEASVLVFKSVFQTAAYAGYPFLSADTGDSQLVRMWAIVPGPPGSELPPRAALHVHVSDDKGIQLSEKRGTEPPTERALPMPASDTELRERMKAAMVDHFLRSDVRAVPMIDIVLHAENRMPFSKLGAVLRGLADAQKRLGGPGDEDGAFSIRLSVN
jgi:hypothetical protein